MGKIHDALRRAEEERLARAGEAAAPAPRPLAKRGSTPSRGEQRREARSARAMLGDAEPAVTEEYRTLRARIQSLRKQRPLKSIVVTSALPQEGKSTLALNLALSFGLEREGRVCLVDADLRSPTIHHGFVQQPEAGLGEFLENGLKLEDILVPIPDTRLSVIMVCRPPSRPSELLASRRMRDLIGELHTRFDTVILDSPPILGLPDATTLMDLSDSVLLVVGRAQASRAELGEALGRIDRTKALGCVFNRTDGPGRSYGYGGDPR